MTYILHTYKDRQMYKKIKYMLYMHKNNSLQHFVEILLFFN